MADSKRAHMDQPGPDPGWAAYLEIDRDGSLYIKDEGLAKYFHDKLWGDEDKNPRKRRFRIYYAKPTSEKELWTGPVNVMCPC